MSQKLDFIEKAIAPGANVSALCAEYGISRQTGHKWIRRYHQEGHLGLVEHSRRPSSSPLATGEDIVVSIVELRDRHPTWGPQKIARVLARQLGCDNAPSRSTVARVLRRLGKIRRRRPAVRIWSVDRRPRVEVKAPNDPWTIDFEGWWRALNGDRCEPLTVRDAYSRCVLAVFVNHVRPHDALEGKTPAELHRESPRRELVPRVPTYPPEWQVRRVNRTGCVRVNGDFVFVSKALVGQLVGLRQETELRWAARFFDVDLGTIEVLPIRDAFVGPTVIEPVDPLGPANEGSPATPSAAGTVLRVSAMS